MPLLSMNSALGLDLLSSGMVSANVVMCGKKLLMLLGKKGAPNRLFEEIPQDHQFGRNVNNQGGAPPATLDRKTRTQRNP